MTGICDGRVAIITGSGRGIGKAHALEFARQGAKVVVNDIGAEQDGSGGSLSPAQEVVEEIRSDGGEAIVNGGDVSNAADCEEMVAATLKEFGRLDAVVNNAGIVRDRMFVSAEEAEWDAVMAVHLKGHFLLSKFACLHWRNEAKAERMPDARIINTSSGAGLMGSIAQAAYSAAKGGIASLTLVQAAELGRYGITANALAPAARTRMTEEAFPDMMAKPDAGFDAMDPANISPFVAWLASSESKDVTGRVFEVEGGKIGVAEGWNHGPSVEKDERWDPADIGAVVSDLLAKSVTPTPVYGT